MNDPIEILQRGAQIANQSLAGASSSLGIAGNLLNQAGSIGMKMLALLENEEARRSQELMNAQAMMQKTINDIIAQNLKEQQLDQRKKEFDLQYDLQNRQFEHMLEQDRFSNSMRKKEFDLRKLSEQNRQKMSLMNYNLSKDKFDFEKGLALSKLQSDNKKEQAIEYLAISKAHDLGYVDNNGKIIDPAGFRKVMSIATLDPRALIDDKKEKLNIVNLDGELVAIDPYTGNIVNRYDPAASLASLDLNGKQNDSYDMTYKDLADKARNIEIQIDNTKNPRKKILLQKQLDQLKEQISANKDRVDTETNIYEKLILKQNSIDPSTIAFNTQGSLFKYWFGGRQDVLKNVNRLKRKYPIAINTVATFMNIADDKTSIGSYLGQQIMSGINWIAKQFTGSGFPKTDFKDKIFDAQKDPIGANYLTIPNDQLYKLKELGNIFGSNIGSFIEQYRKEKDPKKKYELIGKISQEEKKLVPAMLETTEKMMKKAIKHAINAGVVKEDDDIDTAYRKAFEYIVTNPHEFGFDSSKEAIDTIVPMQVIIANAIGNGKFQVK